jgi:hypothetical protein
MNKIKWKNKLLHHVQRDFRSTKILKLRFPTSENQTSNRPGLSRPFSVTHQLLPFFESNFQIMVLRMFSKLVEIKTRVGFDGSFGFGDKLLLKFSI